ncbi:hypothetical protein WAI453_007733 [Rhynchosporium graminicola]
MAEIFGVAAGALSVASLFNNCVDCFDYIQLGRHFGTDFERCQLKLDILKTRLGRWGQATVLNDNPSFATNLPNEKAAQQVQAILEEIALLFRSTQQSCKRYKISAKPEDLVCLEQKDMPLVLHGLHGKLGDVARRRQGRTSLLKKMSWALYDAKNFDKLIKEMVNLVEDLEQLYPSDKTQCKLVEMDIEGIEDEPSLLALTGAADGTDAVLMDLALRKVEKIVVRNRAKDIKSEGLAEILVGNEWAQRVMTDGMSIAEQTENSTDNIEAGGSSKVQVGNRYGVK